MNIRLVFDSLRANSKYIDSLLANPKHILPIMIFSYLKNDFLQQHRHQVISLAQAVCKAHGVFSFHL